MKQKFTILLLFLSTNFIFSQKNYNKILIDLGSDLMFAFGNGNIEYKGDIIQKSKNRNISINPAVGYFINDNLAIGLSIPVKYTKNESEDYFYQDLSYGVAPFLKCFLSESNIKPYFSLDIGYIRVASDIPNNYQKVYMGYIFEGSVGIASFVTKNVAFDAQIGYGYSNLTDDGNKDTKLITNAIGILIGITIVL